MSGEDKTLKGRHRNPHGNDDVHATGKANRGGEVHATGKAARRSRSDNDAEIRPFEQKMQNRLKDNQSRECASGSINNWPDEFVLEGLKYKNEGILSSSSGEAVVFTVSRGGKKFALKMYYYDPEHRPDHKILEKIKGLSGSGLLVNIVSHGEWENPGIPGTKNDYELMDFCEGGSLDGVVLQGNEKALAEVAVRMGAAIDFLSKHGILHRDIKPGNFFYADKNRTQIVLADFGISVECPEGGTVKIDEMRSPVYAAPEFYTNVPGEPAEVGVESDYFSLGVSLLCLWMGKAQLTAKESQLLRSKLNETLPIPKDLSEHTASLIKALTRLKMSDRATFDDIKRWAKGEDLGAGRQTTTSDFRIVFNSDKNQVANSPAELARFLVDEPSIGKKYIYSGRVTRWLEETGRNQIAILVEEIVEEVYPKNKQAGLMSVAYLLDPTMEYVDPMGQSHSDPKEISRAILTEYGHMEDEILNPDSNLMIYLKAHKLDKTVALVEDYITSDCPLKSGNPEAVRRVQAFLAAYYLALLLDRNLNFPVWTDDGWDFVETIDELLGKLSMGAYDKPMPMSAVNMMVMTSPALIVWLAASNPALAGKIRMLHDNNSDAPDSPDFNSASPYRIAYELNPEADLFFNTDTKSPNRCYTIPQIGEYLNRRINQMALDKADKDDFSGEFVYMTVSAVGDFLRARGENYKTFLSWSEFCMDDDNDDNSQKAGPYDWVVGAYKTIAGFLGHAPSYPIGDKLVTSPEQLKKFPKAEVAELISPMSGKSLLAKLHENNSRNPNQEQDVVILPGNVGKPLPWLYAWLSVFYQENPKLDLSKKFTYERETARYVEFIGSIAPEDYYYARYSKALATIDKSARKLRKSEASVKRKLYRNLLLGGIPTVLVLMLSWFFDRPECNPVSGHFFVTLIICCIPCLFYTCSMAGSGGIPAGLFVGAICTVFAWAGFQWFPTVLYLIVGAALLIGGITAVTALLKATKEYRVDTGGKTIKGNEFEYRQLDALYFAYRDNSDTIENAVTKYSAWQSDKNRAAREDIGAYGRLWAPFAWMIAIIWFFATPGVSGSHSWVSDTAKAEKNISGQWAIGRWEAKYASGSTRIVCNIDSVGNGKEIYGTMVIAGQAPVEAKGVISSEKDTIPKSFTFHPVEGFSPSHREINADYSKSGKTMTGCYYDRSGVMHQIVFTVTPLSSGDKTEKTTSTSNNKKKTDTSIESKHENKSVQEEPKKTQKSENLLENEESPVSGLWEDTM